MNLKEFVINVPTHQGVYVLFIFITLYAGVIVLFNIVLFNIVLFNIVLKYNLLVIVKLTSGFCWEKIPLAKI